MSFSFSSYDAITTKEQPYKAQMHSHEEYELYCFLDGQGNYIVEGRRYDLNPGDLIVLQKGEVHLAQVSDQEDYHRAGVHFGITGEDLTNMRGLLSPFYDRPLGKFNHYPAHLFPDNHWEFYLKQLHRQNGKNTQICYLLPLLCELKDQFIQLQQADLSAKKDPAAPIMKYINHHLTENLSLESLSNQFYISQTHLNRLFRKSVGTTVWEYITVKRLFMAKELLENGVPATEVYAQCGFSDYSTFFRAYKHRFGVAPSAHSAKR